MLLLLIHDVRLVTIVEGRLLILLQDIGIIFLIQNTLRKSVRMHLSRIIDVRLLVIMFILNQIGHALCINAVCR